MGDRHLKFHEFRDNLPTTATVSVPETPHTLRDLLIFHGAAEDDGTVHPGRGGLIMTATAPSAPTVMMTPWVAVGHSFMWARLALRCRA